MATRSTPLLLLIALPLALASLQCGAAQESPASPAAPEAAAPIGGSGDGDEEFDGPRPLPFALCELRCERQREPIGIGEPRPLLSWLASTTIADPWRDRRITAWRVVAASTLERFAAGDFDRWDSGRVAGDATAVRWGGAPLPSRAEVWWSVELWNERGEPSFGYPPERFTVGLLDEPEANDWNARWIGAHDAGSPRRTVSPWLTLDFELPADATHARAFVASLGSHQLWIDGERWDAIGGVGGSDPIEFAPGMVDLSRRTRGVAYEARGDDDVPAGTPLRAPQFAAGPHRLGLWLHSAFARHAPFQVAAHPLVRAEIEFELVDGRCITVATGPQWRVTQSSITPLGAFEPGDYGGERIDAARDALPWCLPPANAGSATRSSERVVAATALDWHPVALFDPQLATLALDAPPDRRRESLEVVAIEALPATSPAAWRLDFGKAFNGQVEIELRGAPGATVALCLSERRDESSSWGQRGELVLDGEGRGRFVNRFTPWAGRWLTLRGAIEAPQHGDAEAWLVRPDFEANSSFRCSEPGLQRLDEAAAWTWECLVLGGAPQDCPHRERLGYGGDAHATQALGLGRFDSAAMYARWMDDWAALQADDGDLPFSCPTYAGGGGPAWSGIVVLLAWEQWVRTADREALAQAWPTIARWLAHLETRTRDGLLLPDPAPKWVIAELAWLDDWLAPGSEPRASRFDDKSAFFQNAYRVGCVRRAAELARALQRDDETAALERRGEELAAAVHARFWNEARGAYVNRSSVHSLLALFAELGDEALRETLFAKLVDRFEAGARVDTGLHGTWLLVRELLARDRADVLLALARQEGVPSFQGLLAGDATTLGEMWDGRYSRIHACWLSIGALATEGVLGVRPRLATPGYRAFDVAPLLDAGIEEANGSITTPHGAIALSWAAWHLEPHSTTRQIHLDVPIGTTAHLVVPLHEGDELQLVDGKFVVPIASRLGHAGYGIRDVVQRSRHLGRVAGPLHHGRVAGPLHHVAVELGSGQYDLVRGPPETDLRPPPASGGR